MFEMRDGAVPANDGRPLIGRDDELAAVSRAVQTSRCVVVTGPGGVGKTRLVQQVALNLVKAQEPFDMIRWIQLSRVSRDEEHKTRAVVAATARALGLRENVRGLTDNEDHYYETLRAIVSTLRSAGQVLLVLDNCEHVAAAAADVVFELREHASNVTVLATSQATLGVNGEQAYRVGPLPLPRNGDPENKILGAPAIELLVSRVREQYYGFQATSTNLPYLVKLAAAVGSTPLALQMVARQIAHASPSEVLDQLADWPDGVLLLRGGDRHIRSSHERLELTIGWMWHLASEQERRAWARLSEFRGPFRRDAAVAVIGDDEPGGIPAVEVPELLASLQENSILMIQRPSDHSDGRPCYELLPPVQARGQRELARLGETRLVQQRVLNYFGKQTALARRGWLGPNEMELVLSWRGQHDSLCRVVDDYAVDYAPDQGLQLVMNLMASRVGVFDGIMGQAVGWLDRLRANIAVAEAPGQLALATGMTAWLRCLLGDREGAQAAMQEAGEYEQQAGEVIPMVMFFRGMHTCWGLERPDDGLAQLDAAVEGLGAGEPDRHLAAIWRSIVGAFYAPLPVARAWAEDVVSEAHRAKAPLAISWAHYTKMLVLLREANEAVDGQRALLLQQAKELADRCANLWRDVYDRWSPTWGLLGYALVQAAIGQHKIAAVLLGAARRTQACIDERITFLPGVREWCEALEAEAREQLGETGYETAHQEGWDLGLDALDLALMGPSELPLSHAELRVMRWLATGMNNPQIAEKVQLSRSTVAAHIYSAYNKLGVTGDKAEKRQALIRIADAWLKNNEDSALESAAV